MSEYCRENSPVLNNDLKRFGNIQTDRKRAYQANAFGIFEEISDVVLGAYLWH